MTRRSLGGKADRTGVDRTGGALAWEHELERWMAPFIEGLGHKGRRRWAAPVGGARQYSGQVGKTTNCQCLVSLTKGEIALAELDRVRAGALSPPAVSNVAR